jgi:hypothetical protein
VGVERGLEVTIKVESCGMREIEWLLLDGDARASR